MAKIIRRSLMKGEENVYLLIEHSVGKGGSNRPDDVRCIQLMLNCANEGSNGVSAPLQLDGMCGPKTMAAILAYQKKQNVEYKRYAEDGKVTATTELLIWTSGGRLVNTTLSQLNFDLHMFMMRRRFDLVHLMIDLRYKFLRTMDVVR